MDTSLDYFMFNNLLTNLVVFAGIKYKILPSSYEFNLDGLEENYYEIVKKLWKDTSIIEAFISFNQDLSWEEIELIRSWKRNISDYFVVAQVLKNCIIVISQEEEVYRVNTTLLKQIQILKSESIPFIADLTLLPFKDSIVLDNSFVVMNSRCIKGNDAHEVKMMYKKALKEGRIHTTL